MVEIHEHEPMPAEAEAEAEEDEFELFDVHEWFEAYRVDDEAQAEHAGHAGVPFH